jgi:2'-5' RNA ligase
MAKNLVIVAIPEEQDKVWKISSEKVPHLTLLFLGDSDSNPHVEDIVLFVEHAVEICQHGPFYLDVDRRGTLGPDNADVVFFSTRSWNLKWIKQFRSQLLQNENIRTAYDAADQYDEWQPHLTMGYPVTPAKKLLGSIR